MIARGAAVLVALTSCYGSGGGSADAGAAMDADTSDAPTSFVLAISAPAFDIWPRWELDGVPFEPEPNQRSGIELSFDSLDAAKLRAPFRLTATYSDGTVVTRDVDLDWCDQSQPIWGTVLARMWLEATSLTTFIDIACVTCSGDANEHSFCY